MNDSTLKKYLVGSLVFHCIVVLLGVILSHSATIRHTFVVFGAHSKMPQKTLFKQFENRTLNKSAANRALPVRMPVEQKQVAKPVVKKVAPQAKKVCVKNNVEKAPAKAPVKTPSKSASAASLNNRNRSSIEKKAVVPPVQKKQTDKQVVAQKKPLAQASKGPQKAPEKNVPDQKTLPKEIVASKTEPQKQTEPEAQPDEQVAQEFYAPESSQENIIVAFTDREMLMYQRVVQQEIERTWQPPLGVPKGTECTVRFEIAHNGNVKDAMLVHGSDVLIFDLSALRSARKCMFAQCLWGKIFQVDFRQ